MIRAVVRIVAYALLSLACAPLQAVFVVLRRHHAAQRLPMVYHRFCCAIFGITLETTGTMCSSSPCLFMANHSSYLDIPALGAVIPAHFVAKSEVAAWPVFGWLAKLQNTLFIDRRPSKVGKALSALTHRLKSGQSLILFPEGTSSDGVRVLPFRNALFQAVINEAKHIPALTVQPVTIACVGMNGFPADRIARQKYAWFGDMTLFSHLWQFAHLQSCTLRITFHEPVVPQNLAQDRRTFARTVERTIAEGMAV